MKTARPTRTILTSGPWNEYLETKWRAGRLPSNDVVAVAPVLVVLRYSSVEPLLRYCFGDSQRLSSGQQQQRWLASDVGGVGWLTVAGFACYCPLEEHQVDEQQVCCHRWHQIFSTPNAPPRRGASKASCFGWPEWGQRLTKLSNTCCWLPRSQTTILARSPRYKMKEHQPIRYIKYIQATCTMKNKYLLTLPLLSGRHFLLHWGHLKHLYKSCCFPGQTNSIPDFSIHYFRKSRRLHHSYRIILVSSCRHH